MAHQKLVRTTQVDGGKLGSATLFDRLNSIETLANTGSVEIERLNDAIVRESTNPTALPTFTTVKKFTVAGAVAEQTTINVTADPTTSGNVTVTLNGVTAIVVALLASDNRFQAATKIAAAIDLNASYTATASQGVVTVIALPGTQVDATFADTDTTGTAVTITVVVQGKAGSDLTSAVTVTIPDSVNYVVGKGQLVVFLDGIFQVLGSNYTEASSTTVEFIANTLSDGSEITFIVFDSSKIDYSASYTYDGSNRIQTVTYTGDLAKTVTYTYDASNNVATRVTVEDGVTTTDTYSYVDGKIDTISSVAV